MGVEKKIGEEKRIQDTKLVKELILLRQPLLQEESLQFISLWTQITEEAPAIAEGLNLVEDAEILAFLNGTDPERAYISMIGGQSAVQMASCMWSGMAALPEIARQAGIELESFYESEMRVLADCKCWGRRKGGGRREIDRDRSI